MAICPERTKVVVFSVGLPVSGTVSRVLIHWRQQLKYLGAVFDATTGMSAMCAALHKNMLGA